MLGRIISICYGCGNFNILQLVFTYLFYNLGSMFHSILSYFNLLVTFLDNALNPLWESVSFKPYINRKILCATFKENFSN